jgi:hypothetical protein
VKCGTYFALASLCLLLSFSASAQEPRVPGTADAESAYLPETPPSPSLEPDSPTPNDLAERLVQLSRMLETGSEESLVELNALSAELSELDRKQKLMSSSLEKCASLLKASLDDFDSIPALIARLQRRLFWLKFAAISGWLAALLATAGIFYARSY